MEWNTSLGNIYDLPFFFKVEVMKLMTLQLMICLVMCNMYVCVYTCKVTCDLYSIYVCAYRCTHM